MLQYLIASMHMSHFCSMATTARESLWFPSVPHVFDRFTEFPVPPAVDRLAQRRRLRRPTTPPATRPPGATRVGARRRPASCRCGQRLREDRPDPSGWRSGCAVERGWWVDGAPVRRKEWARTSHKDPHRQGSIGCIFDINELGNGFSDL